MAEKICSLKKRGSSGGTDIENASVVASLSGARNGTTISLSETVKSAILFGLYDAGYGEITSIDATQYFSGVVSAANYASVLIYYKNIDTDSITLSFSGTSSTIRSIKVLKME